MLKDIINIFSGFAGPPGAKEMLNRYEQQAAPKTFDRRMSPYYIRQSETQSMDVDYVQMCINTALQGDMTPLLALYRDIETTDGVIQLAISTRKLAVLTRGVTVSPAPNSGDLGKQISDQVQAMLDRSDSFIDACSWLLHGCIWPVAVVEKKWVPGGNGYSHPEFRPVPLELLDYRTRELRLYDTDERGARLATSRTPDTRRYLVHRGHMLMAPDHWGGPMRALVFWYLFSTQDRQWWARFLERFGAPFLVGHYDKNDDESRLNLVRAFEEATRIFGIVATKETEIEVKETKMDPGEAFRSFYEVARNEKLLVILGQTLSGNAQATGMGSGVADLQGSVREDVRMWDALKLSALIRKAIIRPWMDINGIVGPTPWPMFGGFSPGTLASLGPFLDALTKSGLELEDDGVQSLSRFAGINLRRTAKPSPPAMPPGMGLPFPPRPGLPPAAHPPGAEDGPPHPGAVDATLTLAAAGLTPSAIANASVADRSAADVSRQWSEELAPLAEIVASSRTKTEVVQRAMSFLRGYRPHQSAELLSQALDAYVANAIIGPARDTHTKHSASAGGLSEHSASG